MKARYVPAVDVDAVLDPDGAVWSNAKPEVVDLMGTPVGLQPTAAIRVAWTNRTIGVVHRVSAAALHDGQRLAFRLEWSDATEDREITDTTSFPDGAGILFPAAAGAPMPTMGAPSLPVNAWHWRADENRGRQVVAEGLGTTRSVNDDGVSARGVWKEGHWRVVITRSLRENTTEPVVQLQPGDKTGFGVAVWEGSNGERAGLKAFSVDWRELELEPLPTARR